MVNPSLLPAQLIRLYSSVFYLGNSNPAQDFFEKLEAYEDDSDNLARMVMQRTEPRASEYFWATLICFAYAPFRKWQDNKPRKDPSKIEYYQKIFRLYHSSDLTLNSLNALPLIYKRYYYRALLKALMGASIQLILTILIYTYLASNNLWDDISNASNNIDITALASTVLLLVLVLDQFRGSLVAVRFYSEFHEIYGSFTFVYILDGLFNYLLPIFLLYLNIIVILSAEVRVF